MNKQNKNNKIMTVGQITDGLTYSHEVYGEKFFQGVQLVTRDSGAIDKIPFLISERSMVGRRLPSYARLEGSIRSHNEHDGGKCHLLVRLLVESYTEVEELPFASGFNEVDLVGYLTKQPTYRKTPRGMQIADIMLAVNRPYGKSDYVPCIAWGRNAKAISTLAVGTKISISGRFQSREYTKQLQKNINEYVTKTTYEVSINRYEVLEKKEDGENE